MSLKRNRMRRRFLVPFTTLCILILYWCGRPEPGGYAQDTLLFISTSPVNTNVIFDESPQLDESPLLIRSASPGDHRLEIRGAPGNAGPYAITLRRGEIHTLHFDFVHNVILTNYTASDVLGTAAVLDGSAENPSITYEPHPTAGTPLFPETYPKQKTMDLLNILLPVAAVISGALTVNDAVYPKESGLFFSPATVTSYVATGGLLGYRIALGRQKKKYIEALALRTETLSRSQNEALEQYVLGQERLALDDLKQALIHYTTIVERYDDTIYLPYALYRIAKIHLIEEQYELAARELEHIVKDYPLRDLYDRSLKSLADAYAAQGRYQESIACLDRMVFADPLYSRYAIQRYRRELLEAEQIHIARDGGAFE